MDVVFVSSPELRSADLQLWPWESDPCVWSGKPHEVWHQCKNHKCPLWYGSLSFPPLNWSVTFLSCASYGGAFGSRFPDWRTPTTPWCLSWRYKGGLHSKFRAVWWVQVKQLIIQWVKYEQAFFCCSKNANNSESEVVLYELEVAAMARAILQGWGYVSRTLNKLFSPVLTVPSSFSVSHPDKLFFPPPNWSLSQSLREEQDIGPELQQIYEVHFGLL